MLSPHLLPHSDGDGGAMRKEMESLLDSLQDTQAQAIHDLQAAKQACAFTWPTLYRGYPNS